MKPGKYQHFKNKQFYEVIGTAYHTETREELVVYKSLYSTSDYPENQLWVRPKAMFAANIEQNGVIVPRFRFIE